MLATQIAQRDLFTCCSWINSAIIFSLQSNHNTVTIATETTSLRHNRISFFFVPEPSVSAMFSLAEMNQTEAMNVSGLDSNSLNTTYM